MVDLLTLGGSDFKAISEAARQDSKLRLFTLLTRINRRLEKFFALYWKQEPLSMQLSIVHDQVVVMVRNHETDIHTELSQHSDGFRSFLALVAFVAVRAAGEVKPILLVDEADMHLHYDAQAALVDMFTQQTFAAKIIYTTHSAGCLPEDLGLSVHQIRLSRNSDSEVVNGVWANSAGVRLLLLAMGASLRSHSVRRGRHCSSKDRRMRFSCRFCFERP